MVDTWNLLQRAYGDVSSLLGDLSCAEAGRPTGCAGWAVLDLAQHLVADVRRGLVALSTPADEPVTTDAVGYWRAWEQSEAEADDDRWRTRVVASTAGGIAELADVYAETAAAVLVQASRSAPDARVRTQGHVITVADLLSTLVTETVVHHLDLVVELDRPQPSPEGLASVRAVLQVLLAGEVPGHWDDRTAVLGLTGRRELTAQDRAALGDATARLPLLA